jgi:hypothetical protein
MNRILVAGLLMSIPLVSLWNHTGHHQTKGQQQSVAVVEQAMPSEDQIHQQVEQLMAHAEQQMQVAQQQMQVDAPVVERLVIHRLGVRRLVRQQPQGNQKQARQQVENGLQVVAGDSGVSGSTLKTSGQILQNLSLPVLQSSLGQTPNAQTEITLFSSQRSYAEALLRSGAPQDQVQAIVVNTGGVTVGNQVWIPLYNLKSESDLANVLTHELTHVVFNQEGIGESIPTWINEGVAWHDGMLAHQQVDPQSAQKETNQLNRQLAAATNEGALLPLSASEQDILQAPYNVEWQDYLAVEQLRKQYGDQVFDAFLASIPKYGVEKSFQKSFGMSLSSYEQQFTRSLASQA